MRWIRVQNGDSYQESYVSDHAEDDAKGTVWSAVRRDGKSWEGIVWRGRNSIVDFFASLDEAKRFVERNL